MTQLWVKLVIFLQPRLSPLLLLESIPALTKPIHHTPSGTGPELRARTNLGDLNVSVKPQMFCTAGSSPRLVRNLWSADHKAHWCFCLSQNLAFRLWSHVGRTTGPKGSPPSLLGDTVCRDGFLHLPLSPWVTGSEIYYFLIANSLSSIKQHRPAGNSLALEILWQKISHSDDRWVPS